MVTIGRAAIASPGFAKPAPGEHMNDVLRVNEKSRIIGTSKLLWSQEMGHVSRNLLSSIANFLTADWCEHADRGENFQASLTICECLEKLQ